MMNAQMEMITAIQMLIVQIHLVLLPALVPQAILVMDKRALVTFFHFFGNDKTLL